MEKIKWRVKLSILLLLTFSIIIGYTQVETYKSNVATAPDPVDVIEVLDISGDSSCSGYGDDPCTAEITFTVTENFLANPEELLTTDIPLKKVEASMPNPTLFEVGKEYTISYKTYKNNPDDIIKWSFGPVDPYWYGTSTTTEDDNLVLHIPCEGDFRDRSGQGNDGTQSGGVAIIKGAKGRGCEFDGDDDDISITDSASLDLTENITIALWVKPGSGQKTYADIISKHSNGGFMIEQSAATTNRFYFGWDSLPLSGFTGSSVTTDLTADVWQHFVVVKSGINITHYLNGAQSAAGVGAAGNETIITNNLALKIGDWSSVGGREFNGTIDEFRIYNTSLTASEISSLYNSSKSYHIRLKTTPTEGLADETCLVGKWTMDTKDGSNSTYTPDTSGQGNNADASASPQLTKGRFKEAYLYKTEDSDYFNAGNGASVQFNTGGFAISMWVKPAHTFVRGTDGDYVVLARGYATGASSGYSGYKLHFDKWQGWDFVIHNGTEYRAYEDANAPAEWIHLVGVRNDTHSVLYKDGALVTATIVPSSANLSGWYDELIFGAVKYFSIGTYFNGTIDEIRMYNCSLSATDVNDLYNGGKSTHLNLKTTASLGLVDDSDLVLHYKFDGDALDSSGNGNDGTVTSATINNLGRFKEAYEFDGTDDYIVLPGAVNTAIPGNFTISAWTKGYVSETYSTYNTLFHTAGGNKGTYFLRYKWAGGFQFAVMNGTPGNICGSVISPSGTVLDGTWHHVVGVWDNSSEHSYLYLDGVLKDDDACPGGYLASTCPPTIGAYCYSFPAGPFNGTIDEFRIYNKSLSAVEVNDLYNGTKSLHFRLTQVIG